MAIILSDEDFLSDVLSPAEMREQLRIKDLEIGKLKKQISGYEGRISELGSQILALEDSIKKLESAKIEAEKKSASAEEKRAEAEEQVVQLKKQIDELGDIKQKLADATKAVEELEKKDSVTVQELADARAKVDDLTEQLEKREELSAALEEAKKAVENYKKIKEEQETLVVEAKEVLEGTKKELESALQELGKAKSGLEEANIEIISLKEQVANLTERIASAEEQLKLAEEQHESDEEEKKTLRRQVAANQGAATRARNERDAARTQLGEAQAQLESEREDRKVTESRSAEEIASLSDSLGVARQERDDAVRTSEGLAYDLDKATQDVEAARKKVEETEARAAETIATLEDGLKMANKAKESVSKQLEEVTYDLSKAEKRLAEAEEKVKRVQAQDAEVIARAEDEARVAREEVARLSQEKESIAYDLAEKDRIVAQLNEVIAQLRGSVESETERANTAEAERDILIGKNTEIQSRLSEALELAEFLRRTYSDSQMEIQDLREQSFEYSRILDEQAATIETAETVRDILIGKNEVLTGRLSTRDAEIQALNAQLEAERIATAEAQEIASAALATAEEESIRADVEAISVAAQTALAEAFKDQRDRAEAAALSARETAAAASGVAAADLYAHLVKIINTCFNVELAENSDKKSKRAAALLKAVSKAKDVDVKSTKAYNKDVRQYKKKNDGAEPVLTYMESGYTEIVKKIISEYQEYVTRIGLDAEKVAEFEKTWLEKAGITATTMPEESKRKIIIKEIIENETQEAARLKNKIKVSLASAAAVVAIAAAITLVQGRVIGNQQTSINEKEKVVEGVKEELSIEQQLAALQGDEYAAQILRSHEHLESLEGKADTINSIFSVAKSEIDGYGKTKTAVANGNTIATASKSAYEAYIKAVESKNVEEATRLAGQLKTHAESIATEVSDASAGVDQMLKSVGMTWEQVGSLIALMKNPELSVDFSKESVSKYSKLLTCQEKGKALNVISCQYTKKDNKVTMLVECVSPDRTRYVNHITFTTQNSYDIISQEDVIEELQEATATSIAFNKELKTNIEGTTITTTINGVEVTGKATIKYALEGESTKLKGKAILILTGEKGELLGYKVVATEVPAQSGVDYSKIESKIVDNLLKKLSSEFGIQITVADNTSGAEIELQ